MIKELDYSKLSIQQIEQLVQELNFEIDYFKVFERLQILKDEMNRGDK